MSILRVFICEDMTSKGRFCVRRCEGTCLRDLREYVFERAILRISQGRFYAIYCRSESMCLRKGDSTDITRAILCDLPSIVSSKW